MNTPGDIFDKLSILECREKELKEILNNSHPNLETDASTGDFIEKTVKNCKDSVEESIRACFILEDIKKQKGWLLYELSKIIYEFVNKKQPLYLKKNKLYNKYDKIEKNESIIENIYNLDEQNEVLWFLENERRNKELSDQERLRAADNVSYHNQLRNNYIDNLNMLFESFLSSVKDYQK